MERITTSCFVLIVIASCFYQTEALQCYDGPGISTVKDGCTVCQKTGTSSSGIFSVFVSFDASSRKCVVNGTCVEAAGGAFGIQGGSYCCTMDLCNGASTIYFSSLLSVGVLLVLARIWL